jgi:hypothetical protein
VAAAGGGEVTARGEVHGGGGTCLQTGGAGKHQVRRIDLGEASGLCVRSARAAQRPDLRIKLLTHRRLVQRAVFARPAARPG